MKIIKTSAIFLIFWSVVLGGIYPVSVWVTGQLFFPDEANGSMLRAPNGEIIGSALIGQSFTGDGYFHSRPSAAGAGYDGAASGGSNLGPTSAKLIARVTSDADLALADNDRLQRVPADLVTTSASGLDPHISPAAAEFQINRVARQRGISAEALRLIVGELTEQRTFGFLGEPRINVLRLNLELDRRTRRPETR